MGKGEASLPPSLALVGVGDELLFGETPNTNGSWLGRELSDLGCLVRGQWVVGDDPGEIRRGLREGMDTADVTLVTGGLGPTHDDRTRDVAAEFFGTSLRLDEQILASIQERFRSGGIDPMPGNARRMALVPAGAHVLPNPRGAAPGLILEDRGRACILLPGVPREMRQIFRDGVAPFLRERFEGTLHPVIHRVIHTAGIWESVLARELTPLLPEDMGPVSLAYLPDLRGVRLRLSARHAGDPEEAERWLDRVEDALAPVLADFRYESSRGELADALGSALVEAGKSLATAESCTGGLMAERITDVPGSSRYFMGGVVAYSNAVKTEALGVGEELLAREGAVSRAVAEAMAAGVAKRLGADAGIGITGIAGPGGGTPEKPVGTVFYAAALDGAVTSRREHFNGDRQMVRERSCQSALFLLLNRLRGREGSGGRWGGED